MRCPVSRAAAPRPDISASMPMVTTKVNGDPLTLGRSERWFSTRSIRPCPSSVLCGSFRPVFGSRRPSPMRRGLVSASRAFFSSCACKVGSRNRPVAGAVAVVVDREVSKRPRPGLLPLQRAALGRIGCLRTDHLEQPLRQPPKRRGVEGLRLLDADVASARSSIPGGRSSCSSVSDSTAAVMMPAFSTSITPAASASRVAENRPSSLVARCRSRCRLAVVVLVACASQAGALTAPESAPMSSRSPCSSSCSSSSLSRLCCVASSTSACRCSARGHRPHRHLREPVQRAGQRLDEPQHRVPGGRAGRRWSDR